VIALRRNTAEGVDTIRPMPTIAAALEAWSSVDLAPGELVEVWRDGMVVAQRTEPTATITSCARCAVPFDGSREGWTAITAYRQGERLSNMCPTCSRCWSYEAREPSPWESAAFLALRAAGVARGYGVRLKESAGSWSVDVFNPEVGELADWESAGAGATAAEACEAAREAFTEWGFTP
jgi:hypothetical protein